MPGHAIGPPPDEVGRHEDGPGQPQPAQDRQGVLDDGAVAVVEGDGEDASAAPLADRLGERPAGVAALDQEPKLLLEPRGRRPRAPPASAR